MKWVSVLIFSFLLLGCASTSKVAELESTVYDLQDQINKLGEQLTEAQNKLVEVDNNISKLNNNINQLNTNDLNNSTIPQNQLKENQTSTLPKQCKAITKGGTQCKRNAQEGSDYCWQHQNYSGTSTSTKEKSPNYNDKTIQTGPRGGKYYINSKGKKVYIKKK